MDRRYDSNPDLYPTDDVRTPPVSAPGEVGAESLRPADTSPGGGVPTSTPFCPHLPRYQILAAVGHGGMGQVVRARDLTLGREVAIKFLLRPHDAPPGVVERFKREALILAQLDHPHVVPVYDSGEANGYLYYVMKLVPGGSLARQTAAVRASARRAAELVRKVAVAVQHVHEKGVLHRDLKPGNILVDDRGEPLVVDFGVARWDDGHTATTGFAVFGTPPYLAPEVVRGGSHAADDRSDVWSLGVILYELLAGVRPFTGEKHDPELFTRILTDAPPPFADCPDRLPDADADLEAVCLTCLAKDPANRHPSAAELADALQRWLDGKPVGVSLAAARRAATGADAVPVRKRRWPRVAATVAAMGAAVALLLAPVPWKRGEGKKKPLVERLAKAGDSVTFVDDKGGLLERKDEVPGVDVNGSTKAEIDGAVQVSALGTYLLELGNEPLLFDWRFEAKVNLRRDFRRTRLGIYACRNSHPQPDGSVIFGAVLNGFGPAISGNQNAKPDDTYQATAAAGLLRPAEFPQCLPVSKDWQRVPKSTPAGGDDESGAFHQLVLEKVGGRIRGWYDNESFELDEPLPFEASYVGIRMERDKRTVTGAPLGDGFGLFVIQGTGGYRDVRLTRVSD